MIRINYLFLEKTVLFVDNNGFQTLMDSLDKDDYVTYYKLIHLAFIFDFKELHSELAKWKPQSIPYIIKKAGLQSIFDITVSKELLYKHIAEIKNESIQEQLFFYQILKYYETNFFNDKHKYLSETVETIKSLGFKSIHDTLKQLYSDIAEKEEKIDRYGAGRFSVNYNSFSLTQRSSLLSATQYLQVLLDFALPINIDHILFVSKEDWYVVFLMIYNDLPYPALFFSLQYDNEKFIRRIAQDYINSDNLINTVNVLLPKLLSVYVEKTTSYNLKKNILFFCSELFIAVKPDMWQKEFSIVNFKK